MNAQEALAQAEGALRKADSELRSVSSESGRLGHASGYQEQAILWMRLSELLLAIGPPPDKETGD